MAVSQSGYPMIADYGDPRLVSNPTIPGTSVRVLGGLLSGAVGTILLDVASRYDREVEWLVQALGCWGFDPQHDTYTSTSNHKSGTAVDLNASRHPIGTDPASNFTAAQIAACRLLRDSYGGVVRWGGDYTGRKDGMHWEINDSLAGTGRVEALATKLGHAEGTKPSPAPTPAPAPAKPYTPPPGPFPLAKGHYFGLKSGPAVSHGGYYASEKPYVAWIQKRMNELGFGTLIADSDFGPKTQAAVAAWQRARHAATTTLYGQVWADDYANLQKDR